MPWKTRYNCEYYYQSRREGGRVVSRYVGGGPLAVLAAAWDALDRGDRAAARAEARAAAEREARREAPLEEAVGRSEALAAWALAAAGYHRVQRHDWRRRRMTNTTLDRAAVGPPPPSPLALVGKLERGLADRMVDFSEASRGEADRAETVGKLRAEVLAFAGELAGPDPPPIVRAAAHVAAVAYYDWILARWWAQSPTPPPATAKAIERAERRFHRAARGLHAIQRRLPDVLVAVGQVNIGAGPQQVVNGRRARPRRSGEIGHERDPRAPANGKA